MPYTIQRGDSLSRLAQQHNTTIDELLRLNPTITNPHLIREGAALNLPQVTQVTGPGTGTANPTATVDPTKDLVAKAAQAGLSLNDLSGLLPGSDPNTIRDELAKRNGYDNFDAFTNDVFARPSKTTEDLYKQAYRAAGLDELLNTITDSKNKLAQATDTVGENPWLSEASRVGRVKRLQELASAQIGNNVDLYNARLDQVKSLVERGAQDLSENERIKEARFNFLLQQAESEAAQQKTKALSTYLPDYLNAALGSKKPDTITVGDTLYKWDPEQNNFVEAAGGKSKFTQIGTDKNGNPTYGFVDERNQTVKDAGGNTSGSTGNEIVAGYDITSYATDPTHGAKVQAIYNNIGDVSSAASVDAYIQSKSSGSPITGPMILSAAQKYGVDPKLMLSIMQQDSSFGTKGLGAKTFNPGNVGNTDNGTTTNYGSWPKGVEAVAKNLSGRYVGNAQRDTSNVASAAQRALSNLSSGLTKDQRASLMNSLDAAIQSGDTGQIRNLVLSAAINTLPTQSMGKAEGRAVALDQLDSIESLLNQYVSKGGQTNILTGKTEQIAQKLGKTTNPELASIGNQILLSVVAYRNAVSGAAFTESEAKQYEGIFPSIGNVPELNKAKIDSLRTVFNQNQRSVLGLKLGSKELYDQLVATPQTQQSKAGRVAIVNGKGYLVGPDGDTLIGSVKLPK